MDRILGEDFEEDYGFEEEDSQDIFDLIRDLNELGVDLPCLRTFRKDMIDLFDGGMVSIIRTPYGDLHYVPYRMDGKYGMQH